MRHDMQLIQVRYHAAGEPEEEQQCVVTVRTDQLTAGAADAIRDRPTTARPGLTMILTSVRAIVGHQLLNERLSGPVTVLPVGVDRAA